jgi:hypothetical protein
MKQWISNRLLSIKYGALYVRALFNPVVGVLYVLLFIQWILTPYVHVGHFLFTFFVVLVIDALAFARGIKVERDWHQHHPH